MEMTLYPSYKIIVKMKDKIRSNTVASKLKELKTSGNSWMLFRILKYRIRINKIKFWNMHATMQFLKKF